MMIKSNCISCTEIGNMFDDNETHSSKEIVENGPEKSLEAELDLSKSFKELVMGDGPKSELELGLIELVGRHFSDAEITHALEDKSVGEVLEEAIKKENDKKIQRDSRAAADAFKEADKEMAQELALHATQDESIGRVMHVAENVFAEKKGIDYGDIGRGGGALENAMETENQFIAKGTKYSEVSNDKLGELSPPETPPMDTAKGQSKSR